MYINTFKYTPKDVSCQLCTEYVKKLGCTALRCPWLAERIEAGVVGYREAVLETFPHERRLFQRLNLLIKHYPGSLWSNEQHERRMQYQCAVQGYRRRRDTLGDGYTPADLRAVIAGEKAHTPRKNAAAPVKPEKRSGNLLVDIQTKLRAGKGAGYARWATLFNLKQMAQTVAYLQDHELLDYAVLSEKAAEASAHFNELSARIKAAETRMAEIAVLREHIVNYAKTRDTYVAYRKAGYSKKFLAEHESEITIHKAAKNYFDGLGFKKLPTIKALNTEYAELLAEKKAAYADYRKAREEMKELLTAKANIDRILELDKEQEEANERREKEAEQR